jgi:hypothetical protein
MVHRAVAECFSRWSGKAGQFTVQSDWRRHMVKNGAKNPLGCGDASPAGTVRIAAVLTAIIVALIAGGTAVAQPVQWSDNGHYYELVRDQVSWTAANVAASAASFDGLAGHLATITSEAENDFIRDSIAVDELAWIGLTDEGSEGTFAWVTGEAVVYTNWVSGEPGNGSEDYAEFIGFFGGQQGQWNDIENDSGGGRFYLIEYEVASGVPTLTLAGVLVLALSVLVVARWRLG